MNLDVAVERVGRVCALSNLGSPLPEFASDGQPFLVTLPSRHCETEANLYGWVAAGRATQAGRNLGSCDPG